MGNTQKTGYLQNLIQYDGSGNIVLPGTLTISTNKLVATQEYVGTQVAALVNSAPTTLDTLNELAAALGNDPNFATTVASSIGSKVPSTRNITINGTTYDLSADRSWTIVGGVSSFNTRTGAITLTDTDVTGALGYTPVTNARTLTINGTTYDLSADRSWTIGATSSARNIQTITADGTTATYTVTNGYVVGLVDVYRNGVKLGAADITATNGTTVTLGVTPASGDIIEIVNYVTALTQNNALRTVNTFNVASATNTFTVSYTQGLLDVYYNGSKLTPAEYTATNGTSVVLSTNAAVGSVVEIITYNYSVSGFSGIGGGGTTNYLPKFTGASTIGNSLIFNNGVNTYIGESGNSQGFWLKTNTTSGSAVEIGAYTFGTNSYGDLVFNTSDSANGRMRITAAGNVGIGTSSPTQLLTLGGTASPQMSIVSSSTTGSSEIYFGDSAAVFRGLINYDHSSDGMIFYTAATEAIRLTSDNHLILKSTSAGGTNLDMYLLENDGLFINSNEGATARNIYFQVGGTEVMRINGATRDLYLGSSTIDKNSRFVTYGQSTDANYYALRAFSSGSDVLLGLRNDGLIVSGTTSLSPYNYSVSGRAMYVNSGGVIGYNSSTRESKSNINSITDTTWLSKLNPVSFNKRKKDDLGNYIDEVYEELDYGFIADEVEQVNTDLVFYDILPDGTKKLAGVCYEKLTSVLVKAIQELKAEIEILKAK